MTAKRATKSAVTQDAGDAFPSKKEWPASSVERRSVESLVPYARNARTHSDEQVAQIAASIREWGWTTPILVDEQDGIIAGEMTGRSVHAIELSPEYVDVAIKRWQGFTGKDATLDGDGRTFAEIEAGRHGENDEAA